MVFIKKIYIMAIIKKTKLKKTIPLEKEELLELIWIDIVNGLSRYQISLKLDRDAYPNHHTSNLSKSCEYELKENKDKQRDLFYERVLSVYNDSVDQRDRQSALKALDMIGKLGGLYAKEEKDVNITGTIKANISFGIEGEDNGD